MNTPIIEVRNLSKTFVLHQQGGVAIEALSGISFSVDAGECVALHGPSGAGKSTLLRALYGNYLPTGGSIRVRCGGEDVDITSAAPRTVIRLRRGCISYVSQFLRVIPRVSTLDWSRSRCWRAKATAARSRAEGLLARLNLPERLWHIAPATFSGGEQRRVNIARGFIRPSPISCSTSPRPAGRREPAGGHRSDPRSAWERAAIVGIFHDDVARKPWPTAPSRQAP
ncbi:MAG: phosphonate C-P lyase system protein PhnL [Bilophila wadsworthia]